MSEVEKLKESVARMQRELYSAMDALYLAQQDELGIHVGDLVSYRGNVYRVSHFSFDWIHKPWIKGHRRKKDGTFATLNTHLFNDWKKICVE